MQEVSMCKMMDILKYMVKLCAQMVNMIRGNLLQFGKDSCYNENLHSTHENINVVACIYVNRGCWKISREFLY